MSEKEIINNKKRNFLIGYSKELYVKLSTRTSNNSETLCYMVAKLLLNPNHLNECDELIDICRIIDTEKKESSIEYYSKIIGLIVQRLNMTGSYDESNTVSNYFLNVGYSYELKANRL